GKVKGNIDAELVLHAMIEYPNYERALIVTGDGDFYCLIEYLNKQGKLSALVIPDKDSYSSLLRKFMVKIDFMNSLKDKLKLGHK
ncbi:MAG: NYN domain-containing protein, partial [Candidatus Omnitrophota bacterium]|nr:NYN domain-containing protein [Candidatus Omnitrophota bacterium]